MSNYPPGVTGNEWQIAGADERVISVACESGFNLTANGDPQEDQDCGFSGEVDAYSTDGETWVWDCPRCKTADQEEIVSYEPDDEAPEWYDYL